MEKFKKPFIISMATLIFLVAIVSALSMMDKTSRMGKEMGVSNSGMSFDGESSMPKSGLSKGMAGSVAVNRMAGDSFSEMDSENMMTPDLIPGGMETEKKEIKNGSLNLRVANADKAAENISKIAKDNGGEIFSSNFYQADKNIKNGNVEVRVPVTSFEKTFSELKKVATVVIRESTFGRDVTMEYSDLQIQLKNKQAEEQSFVRILDQAGKISDVLDVTQQVARVRGEIERLQGQIRFMDSQTDMANISISVTEDTTVALSDKWRPLQVAKDTINGLLKDIQGFVDFVIVLIIRVIPILVLYGMAIFLVYFIVKKLFFRNKA